MPETLIQGYLNSLTVDSNDITPIISSGTLDRTRQVNKKALWGSAARVVRPGAKDGTIQVEGVISVEKLGYLEAAYESDASMAFTWAAGESGGATEAGTWTGSAVCSALSVSGDGEDDMGFSMTLDVDGAVTYTAPA